MAGLLNPLRAERSWSAKVGMHSTNRRSSRIQSNPLRRPPLPGKPSGTLNPRCPACPKEARLVNQRAILTRECESSEPGNTSCVWRSAVGLLDYSDPKAGRKIRDKLDAICSELRNQRREKEGLVCRAGAWRYAARSKFGSWKPGYFFFWAERPRVVTVVLFLTVLVPLALAVLVLLVTVVVLLVLLGVGRAYMETAPKVRAAAAISVISFFIWRFSFGLRSFKIVWANHSEPHMKDLLIGN